MAPPLPASVVKERQEMFTLGYHWCTKCEEFLPLSRFAKSKGTDTGYYGWCKPCHSKARKGKPRYQRKARAYARQLRSYYKKLAGGRCLKCGYNRSQAALEFHHVDPDDKEDQVTSLISTNDHPRIILEINKCILLCRNCHMEFEAGVWTAKFTEAKVGHKIIPGTVIENEESRWFDVSGKIIYSQHSLFLDGDHCNG